MQMSPVVAIILLLLIHIILYLSAFTLNNVKFAATKCTQTTKRIRSRTNTISMMSIGVPRVAYRMPGSRYGEWVDILDRLSRERMIFLCSEINEELANQIIAMLLVSNGGSVIPGLAIYDTMQHIKCEVVTVKLGLAASMASFLLCGGSKGKRYAMPHSRVMIHQPMGETRGHADDIRIETSQIMRIRDNIVSMYAKMSGKSKEKIALDIDRNYFMSAEEALHYGLIDAIVQPNDIKIRSFNATQF